MRVWRYFIRIVRLYLKLCILATLSMLFCYGIFNSLFDIISAITHFVRDGKFYCLVCVNTDSLNFIHFPLWTLTDSPWYLFLILADGTIVYDTYSAPIRWSRVMLCVCHSPILSVSLEGMGCETVLNLAATFWWGTIPSTFGEVDVCELYYWPANCFSGAFLQML